MSAMTQVLTSWSCCQRLNASHSVSGLSGRCTEKVRGLSKPAGERGNTHGSTPISEAAALNGEKRGPEAASLLQ